MHSVPAIPTPRLGASASFFGAARRCAGSALDCMVRSSASAATPSGSQYRMTWWTLSVRRETGGGRGLSPPSPRNGAGRVSTGGLGRNSALDLGPPRVLDLGGRLLHPRRSCGAERSWTASEAFRHAVVT
eukprot:1684462-Pyramimonas_sp.AAC.1